MQKANLREAILHFSICILHSALRIVTWYNDVPAGTYFINLSVGEKIVKVKKIVVVR